MHLAMNKFLLLVLLITCGLCSRLDAQLFFGLGANAQLTDIKDSYVSMEPRGFVNETRFPQISWSPALRMEYVLSANSYVSGTFSHLTIRDYGFDITSTNSRFTGDKIKGLQGRFMGGWVFDHFGLEAGVVLIQSYVNERTLITPPDLLSSIVEIERSNTGFTQLYPCISGTYKYGSWLGVLSGTFSSDRYSPKGQTLTTVVPQFSLSFGVFYIWKAVAAPRLTSPRF